MLTSPTGAGEMQAGDLETMLGEMIDCGRRIRTPRAGGRALSVRQLVNALREIHRGTHRPYPCGAGAGYLGVSADGELSACHRFVGDEDGAMGSLDNGIDRDRQAEWLADAPRPPAGALPVCWARYLCGGGCHHEVIQRGRPACDYIRGWLHYCLEAYLRLSSEPANSRDAALQERPMAEVCVIGAGPAGSTFAARMAQLGHQVDLIERQRFPRGASRRIAEPRRAAAARRRPVCARRSRRLASQA